jgi:hypothetical protein
VTIPDESIKKIPAKSSRLLGFLAGLNAPTKDTKGLLQLYAEKYFLKNLVSEKAKLKMADAEPGLFIIASSLPDVAALIATAKDEENQATDMDISIGEIKNSTNFSTDDAINQTACYLMLLMYWWWRAWFGREMEDVYGFAVCGPLCKDTKGTTGKRNFGGQRTVHSAQYSISIAKLSTPATLGKMNAVTVLSNSYYMSVVIQECACFANFCPVNAFGIRCET